MYFMRHGLHSSVHSGPVSRSANSSVAEMPCSASEAVVGPEELNLEQLATIIIVVPFSPVA